MQYILQGPAGHQYAEQWPELLNVTTALPCVPAFGSVYNNTFCKTRAFTDAPVKNGVAWNTTFFNNVQVTCPSRAD